MARYAGLLRDVGVTRGEEGLVVSMNTRWIPHYVRFRQELGLEPVRFNYGPTSHEPLAQSRGIFTFHLSPDKALWQTFGELETRAAVFTIPETDVIGGETEPLTGYSEICRSGIESAEPIKVTLGPILATGSRGKLGTKPLPAGHYKLTLLTIEPTATRAGERLMQVTVDNVAEKNPRKPPAGSAAPIDIFKQAGGRNRILALQYPVVLEKPGNPQVILTPVVGRAILCGVLLASIDERNLRIPR